MMPDYVGPCAFGIKMGLVLRGSDLISLIMDRLTEVNGDGLLCDGDVVCITESVLARAQDNYVTTGDVARAIREKLSLAPDGRVGVVFPIMSRNRFSLVLEGIAEAVPKGEVVVQLSYPRDEVGNMVLPQAEADVLEDEKGGCFFPEDFDRRYVHPLTGIDYTQLYRDVVTGTGASARLYLCNDAEKILDFAPDGVIAADIHTREATRKKITGRFPDVITLQDIFCSKNAGGAWSEWGLLGSNMASGKKLKLAPRECDRFVAQLRTAVRDDLGKDVEVIIYGDGAYKDPSSGIYELADPCAAFGATPGVNSILRTGIKLKYMVDMYQEQGLSEEEICRIVEKESREKRQLNSAESEGTTPRRMEDLLASLADLVSGSADAGTPMVLAKGFIR